MADYPVFNSINYNKNLASAISNVELMHGVRVEVLRIKDREANDYVTAFGPQNVNLKSEKYLQKVADIYILTTPQDMYNAYIIGSGNGELEIATKNEDLFVGDIIRYKWTNNQILEFTVIELPRTFGECYYIYKIKSTYQVK